MRKKEEKILKMLLEQFRNFGEVEITASGFVMLIDIDLSPYEAAKILRRIAAEVYRDNYFNHNVYKINIHTLMEMVHNEGNT